MSMEKIGHVVINTDDYPGEDLYSDGAVEDELLKIAREIPNDRYDEEIAARKDWAVMYHFSPLRENILSWYPFKKTDRVLEIGSGCGAVTGALAGAACSVTCIELSKKRSLINAYRNRDHDNIEIRLGNFETVEEKLPDDYDVVTLIGVFEYGRGYIAGNEPYHTFLKKAMRHVKPGGVLLIAIENRLGLKYYAGCREDHTGVFFEGIEGYRRETSVRTFSKIELTRIFEECGYGDHTFYYPYPDYKFPMAVYSDRYLPRQGDLRQNIENYDRSRMLLFDESRAYDSLLPDGLFPLFSNSFLAVVRKGPSFGHASAPLPAVADTKRGDEACAPSFVKYSNERRRSLRIRTEISSEGETVSVRKLPASPKACGHIEALVRHGKDLARLFAGSRYVPNEVHMEDGCAVFEYIDGPTLEEKFDELIPAGDEALLSAFDSYFGDLDALADTEFRASDDFRRVFGDVRIPDGAPAMSVSDIDLVLNNVILKGDRRVVIDYEWTFDFPVPLSFIKWRILHYYLTGNSKRLGIDGALYIERAGISPEEAGVYASMERSFQSYVNGDYIPRRDLYGDISDGTIDVYNLVRGYEGSRIASIYPDAGSGYSEETRMTAKVGDKGEVRFCLPLSGVQKVRIDPLECPCFVEDLRVDLGDRAMDPASFRTDGVLVEGEGLFFPDADPQIEVPVPENAQGPLTVTFRVTSYDRLDSSRMSLGNAALRDEIRRLRDACSRKDAVILNRLELARDIRGQRSEKLLRKATKITGREDPFNRFHPVLQSDPEGLCVNIDEISTGVRYDRVRGWCFDRAFDTETIRVKDADGTEIPADIKRGVRRDVTEVFGLAPSRAVGFTVDIPVREGLPGHYIFEIENLRGVFRKEIRTADSPDERKLLVRRGAPAITREAYEGTQPSAAVPAPDVTDADLKAFDEAFAVVTGQEDELKPYAKDYMAAFLKNNPSTDLLYWDDESLEGGEFPDPHFKPDYNPAYLCSANYIGRSFAVRKKVLDETDLMLPLREEDFYDLLLHITERTDKVGHIPCVLSARRGRGLFETADLDVCAASLRAHYERCGVRASVIPDTGYRVLRSEFESDRKPLVSVLIPNKDHAKDLRTAVDSVMTRGGWENIEIIVIENNSEEAETFRAYEELKEKYPSLTVVTCEGAFNYSAVNNLGARKAQGAYLLFLNNDTEVIAEGSIKRLAEDCMQSGVGAVGARMYFGDDTVQHAGVIIGYGGFAGHCFSGAMRGAEGYMKRIVAQMELSAVTAACMMVKRTAYEAAGGFDPSLAVALNDIDLCLKIGKAGYKILYEPGAELYHYESKSRGYEDSRKKRERFASEVDLFKERWKDILKDGDPSYNPNLTLVTPDFALRSF